MTDTPFTTFAYPVTGGSANRTTPARLADVRSVLEFTGADNTGASGGAVDNASAFEAAIAAGGHVYVPAGTYTFTRGINVDAFGGNGSFSMSGAGDSTILTASMDDFIFCKVLRNTGSVSSCRSIRDMKFNNTKLTLASPTTNISGFTWGVFAGGNLAGQTGLTVTATAHGFTVGSSRLMNVAGIVCTGVDPNGLVGCYFNDANHFQYFFDTGNPGTYTSGGTYAPRGGAVAMIAYYGGALHNVNFSGYYGFYGEQDCTVDLFDCGALGSGNVGTGIITAGQSGIYGCDVSGWATGIQVGAGIGLGCAIAGGRIEINTVGISLPPGASYVHISGLTMEFNIIGIQFQGSGWCTVSAVQIHGSTSGGRGTSTAGIYFYGANNHITISETYCYGDYSNAAIVYDTPATSQGIRFRNVRVATTGGGGTNTNFPASTVCPQWDSCLNMNGDAVLSTFANRPSSSYALRGETWWFTDSAVAAGSSTAISGGGANSVIGRFDGTNWYVVCRAG